MDDQQIFQQVIAQQGLPAYLRRAQRVQQAYDQLLARCRRQRSEWLNLVTIQLGTLRALAGDWPALVPLLADDSSLAVLR